MNISTMKTRITLGKATYGLIERGYTGSLEYGPVMFYFMIEIPKNEGFSVTNNVENIVRQIVEERYWLMKLKHKYFFEVYTPTSYEARPNEFSIDLVTLKHGKPSWTSLVIYDVEKEKMELPNKDVVDKIPFFNRFLEERNNAEKLTKFFDVYNLLER